MELDVDSKIAAPGETVQVHCHSQQADELIWLDPNGQTVPMHDAMDETATEPYATVTSMTASGTGRTAVLHIPRVSYSLTGDYMCRHPSAKSDREFRLRMKQGTPSLPVITDPLLATPCYYFLFLEIQLEISPRFVLDQPCCFQREGLSAHSPFSFVDCSFVCWFTYGSDP